MKSKEIEKIANIRERIENKRSEIQESIDNYVENIKAVYGIGLTDEEYERIWKEKFDHEIELYLKDANKSFISEEEKKKAIEQKRVKFQERFQKFLDKRKVYLGMSEEEIRQQFVSEGRQEFNNDLLFSASNSNYGNSGSSAEWAADKNTRTLVGEIKYIEFMNLEQKQRKEYIKKELKNFASKVFGSSFAGMGFGIIAGIFVAVGHEMAFDNITDEMLNNQWLLTVGVSAFLAYIITALKHSKAFSLIQKMRKNKKTEYGGSFDEAIDAAQESHTSREGKKLDYGTYLENLDLVNVAQDAASRRM